MALPAIHPGEHLVEELTELNMTATELARELGVPTNRITDIIRGRRGISADTALRLARWFGTSPQFWLNLQQIYDLRIAEAEHGDEINARIVPRKLPNLITAS